MRKVDRLAQEKYNGDVKKAIEHLIIYSTPAEINNFWHEWSEDEQRYAAAIERSRPKKRFLKEIGFWLAWLIAVPLGIIIAAIDTAAIYKYGTLPGILLIIAELCVLWWFFRKKIKISDIAVIVIIIILGILSLIALVLSEVIRENLILFFESFK